MAQKTGFGLVFPLPGIWPALHLDTGIALPVGVEAYAARTHCAPGWQGARSAHGRGVREVVRDLLVPLRMAGQAA